MTKLEQQLTQFERALNRLEEVLNLPISDVTRDSAIQRFEFCLDLGWKSLQTYLKEKKGIVANSPKDAFREASLAGIIEPSDDWIKFIDLRNETVHTYDEQTAKNVFRQLPEVLTRLKSLLSVLTH